MSVLIQSILYALAGFVQEVLITSYHRAVISQRNLLACGLTASITILSLLVVTGIIRKILDPTIGILSFIYVIVFALGKAVGAYGSLSWWSKKTNICSGKGNCQRRD